MELKRILTAAVAGLLLTLIPPSLRPCAAQEAEGALDKVTLQARTQETLEDLDHLTSQLHTVSNKRSALFSDQQEENLCGYRSIYEGVETLLKKLEKLAEQWKTLSERNPKDKIYRAYLATTYLAMYSLYSRTDDFLTFLKLAPEYKNRYSCLSGNLPDWYERKYDWTQNAEKMLMRAQECVSTALSVDSDYRDGLIVKAELLAMQGKYDEADALLEKLYKDGWFRDKEAFYYSWRAFLDSKRGKDPASVEDALRKASAGTKPFENSNWASTYSRALRTVDFSGVLLTACGYEGTEATLPELEQWTIDAVSRSRAELSRPLLDIPLPLPAEFNPEEYAAQGDFFLTLETDTSDYNLAKYAGMIRNLYGAVAGYDYSQRARKSNPGLMILMGEWDKLAKKNEGANFYYLMRKVQCGTEIRNIVNLTKPLVDNKSLSSYLASSQSNLKEADRIKYQAKWQEWDSSVGYSMDGDIRAMHPKNVFFPAADYAAFEYAAVTGEPIKGMMELEALATGYDKNEVKFSIPVLERSGAPLSGPEYFRAWRTYLAFKMGDMTTVKRIVNEAGAFGGLQTWEKNQKKLIELESREKK
ncbi:MAG: hypothetical protein AB1921_19195 [Thermodesulfobacteriota bacterium]